MQLLQKIKMHLSSSYEICEVYLFFFLEIAVICTFASNTSLVFIRCTCSLIKIVNYCTDNRQMNVKLFCVLGISSKTAQRSFTK